MEAGWRQCIQRNIGVYYLWTCFFSNYSVPTVESDSDSVNSSSEDEGAKFGKKKAENCAQKGSGMYTTHFLSPGTDLLEVTMDETGMLNDVVVLELSDNDSEDKPKNGIIIPKNKNLTANIEDWEPVPHSKGDARAHCQCLCCK